MVRTHGAGKNSVDAYGRMVVWSCVQPLWCGSLWELSNVRLLMNLNITTLAIPRLSVSLMSLRQPLAAFPFPHLNWPSASTPERTPFYAGD